MPRWTPGSSRGLLVVEAETVVPSAARTTTGNQPLGAAFADLSAFRLQLDVSAASGTTPTLDVAFEDSFDGINWNVVRAFTQKTGVSREVISVGPTELWVATTRIRWTIGGATPSFTFSVIAVPIRDRAV